MLLCRFAGFGDIALLSDTYTKDVTGFEKQIGY
jgi:hypothetical protein